MRDLYKRSNFPTRIDIFGEECYVSRIEYDEKFDVEILFGRPVSNTRGAKRVILTPEFKEFILNTWNIPLKKFDDKLKACTVKDARRKIKSNPFKSYYEWIRSRDVNKPKEIRLLDVKNNPEFIEDYLGVKHIILSAKMTDEGLVFPLGVPVHIYRTQKKKTKKYILTSTLVDLIKEYRYNARKGIHKFPFDIQTFIVLKGELGMPKSEKDDRNLWLSAHLSKILTMTNQEFYDQYASKVHISKNTIATIKTACHHFRKMAMSKDEKERRIYTLLKSYARSSNEDRILRSKLLELMPIQKLNHYSRSAYLLFFAKKNNHEIPIGYKRLV